MLQPVLNNFFPSTPVSFFPEIVHSFNRPSYFIGPRRSLTNFLGLFRYLTTFDYQKDLSVSGDLVTPHGQVAACQRSRASETPFRGSILFLSPVSRFLCASCLRTIFFFLFALPPLSLPAKTDAYRDDEPSYVDPSHSYIDDPSPLVLLISIHSNSITPPCGVTIWPHRFARYYTL